MAAVSGDKSKRKRGQVELPPLPDELGMARPAPHQNRLESYLYRFPWWALILALIGIWVAFAIAADELYSDLYGRLREGVNMTLRVTFSSYTLALVVGLIVGTIRTYKPKPPKGATQRIGSFLHLILYNVSTLFVEIMRGLPILIVLLISAFVIVPAFKDYMKDTYNIVIDIKGASVETAIIALALAYGAYISEIIRGGIQSIDKGQVEAARSLGMTQWQTLRFIVLPQAFRRVVPPLGNDFIAMIKDSSLIAFLGIRDVTQLGKIISGSNFQYMPTYTIVAVIYLTLTILGSVLVQLIERYLDNDDPFNPVESVRNFLDRLQGKTA